MNNTAHQKQQQQKTTEGENSHSRFITHTFVFHTLRNMESQMYDKQNNCRQLIYTIYVHCRKIYNLFLRARNWQKSDPLRCECKSILYLTTMYVYCVYLAISKSPKHLRNCLKIIARSVVLIVLNDVICDVSPYTVAVSFCRST